MLRHVDSDGATHDAIINACMEHYDSFSVAEACNDKTLTSATQAREIDNSLLAGIKALRGLSESLSLAGETWNKQRQVSATAAAHASKVSDLLEAPQTLESCLKCDAFDEALLVLDYIEALHNERPESEIKFIRRQTNLALTDGVAVFVLPRLAKPLSVMALNKIFTFLHRIGLDWCTLREIFLEKKTALIDSVLVDGQQRFASTHHQSHYSRLRSLLSAFNIALAEAVTQYSSCFAPSSTMDSSSIATDKKNTATAVDSDESVSLLSLWAHEQTDKFIRVLSSNLAEIISGAEIASLANHLPHLSASLSKIGCDIVPILTTQLCQHAVGLFASHLASAQQIFTAAMSEWPSSGTSDATNRNSFALRIPEESNVKDAAPLMQHIPLALTLNRVLVGFNELRKCAFFAVTSPCVEAVVLLIRHMAKTIGDMEADPLLEPPSGLPEFKTAFQTVFLPKVERSLVAIFPHLSSLEDVLHSQHF